MTKKRFGNVLSIHSLALHGHTLQALGLNCMCEHEYIVRILEKCEALRTLYLTYVTEFDDEEGRVINVNTKELNAAYPHVKVVHGMHVQNVFAFNPFVYPTYMEEVL